ncbi:protein of unknown function [Taphrina deformans PYCC 5710]|uniref:Rab-GAP TBC domain-containing protein n=1 Tax=Taphrina deformans (strain PYCC 5710 / ATCC 11124 / CBS 356.35 / IMI 108563 / JCM 9778 / NBRC 8474) TaxID=1097556 RepID=R4XE48_TAPDE|nr:protein of unknown function [Taphrina deformans PYCC 5710]|eukprot:CCG84127.1 protein of unknown function [Taphrina deformans PYCC 5710]
MKQMVQLSSSDPSNPSVLGPQVRKLSNPSGLHRSSSIGNVYGASYSHTDLPSLQHSANLSRTSTPNPLGSSKHSKPSTKLNNLLQETEDDWASDLDDGFRAAERRRQMLIKSIEHRPSSFESVSLAPLKKTHSFPHYPVPQTKGGLRPHCSEIMTDPGKLCDSKYHASKATQTSDIEDNDGLKEAKAGKSSRLDRFKRILTAPNIDLSALRKLAWNGVPEELRPMVWQLLLGYLPLAQSHRITTLQRKRKEYVDAVHETFGEKAGSEKGHRKTSSFVKGLDQAVWHQIHIDVPRTNPLIRLYQFPATQRSLERILYIWALRHPASGYVQGINDLLTPFYQVFLGAYLDCPVDNYDPAELPTELQYAVEADSYWCLSKLLDGIQDNYIHSQPGIIRQVNHLRELTQRIDTPLVSHLESENIEFIQFSFRWMNCLLMRELSISCVTRMWDTYLSEPNGFSDFHLYVCTAFLVKFSAHLQTLEFQEIMIYIQNLPTQEWTDQDVEMLLSEAYLWKSLWSRSPNFARR